MSRKKAVMKKAIEHYISDNEKRFAELYCNSNEYRGNGLRCYAEVYEIDLNRPGAYNSAKVNASKLLSKIPVLNYIRAIFEHDGLNEEMVSGELLLTIRQCSDYGAKVAGIKLFYELTGKLKRIKEPEKLTFNISIASDPPTTFDVNHTIINS